MWWQKSSPFMPKMKALYMKAKSLFKTQDMRWKRNYSALILFISIQNIRRENVKHCHRIRFFFQALQEFCDLCSKEDDLKTSEAGMLLIMPYWPRLYSRLANDQDRRVREMAQKAHLVGKYTLRDFFIGLESLDFQSSFTTYSEAFLIN